MSRRHTATRGRWMRHALPSLAAAAKGMAELLEAPPIVGTRRPLLFDAGVIVHTLWLVSRRRHFPVRLVRRLLRAMGYDHPPTVFHRYFR